MTLGEFEPGRKIGLLSDLCAKQENAFVLFHVDPGPDQDTSVRHQYGPAHANLTQHRKSEPCRSCLQVARTDAFRNGPEPEP